MGLGSGAQAVTLQERMRTVRRGERDGILIKVRGWGKGGPCGTHELKKIVG
jgi:hypothetical protein